MSRIIALSSIQVKPTRRAPKPAAPFGAGILAARPTYSAPYTLSDEAWLIAERAAAESRHYDEMEEEAIALARLDMGLCF